MEEKRELKMVENRTIQEDIIECVRAYSNHNGKQSNFNSNIISDLGLDSLQIFDFISVLENKYNIMINEQDFIRLLTVQDIVSYVDSLLQNKKG